MKTVTVAMKAHLNQEVTSLCTCWKITRTDSVVMTFTDHDEDITFQGFTYLATGGYERSAISTSASFAVDNVDVNGIIDSDLISEADLRNGVYDYAAVEMFIVNWADLSMGSIKIRRGWFGEVTITPSGMFTVELRGLTQLLSNNVGEYFTPECGADLGDKRCRVMIDPPTRVPNQNYPKGARVRATVLDGQGFAVAAPLVNRNFDDSVTPGFQTSIPGWTREMGSVYLAPSDLMGFQALEGRFWLTGYSDETRVSQTFSLGDIGLSNLSIDTGLVSAETVSWHANQDERTSTRVEIIFMDAGNNVLAGGYDTGLYKAPINLWTSKRDGRTVPAGTRKVKVRLTFKLTDPYGWWNESANSAGIDNLSMVFKDDSGLITDSRRFGNVEFVATTGGRTANVIDPGLTNAPGSSFADGTVTWQCVAARYFAAAQVAKPLSRRSFELKGISSGPYPDDWFDHGVLTFESGLNKGRRVEIKNWTSASKRIDLVVPLPYTIAVDDVVSFYAGCNKDRETCRTKFGNVINFRGFPDVPGNDFFIRKP